MRSAVLFLPFRISEFTNFPISLSWNRGSAAASRGGILRRRDMTDYSLACPPSDVRARLLGRACLGALRPVFRPALSSILHSDGVESATHKMIANSGKILHPAASHQHDRVLLKIVADTRNIRGHFHSIRQTDAGDFAQRGIWFLRGRRVDADTDASLLRTSGQGRALRLEL